MELLVSTGGVDRPGRLQERYRHEEDVDGTPRGCHAGRFDRLPRTRLARRLGPRPRGGADRRRDRRWRHRLEPLLLWARLWLLRPRLLPARLRLLPRPGRPLLLAAPALLGWVRLARSQRPRLRLIGRPPSETCE